MNYLTPVASLLINSKRDRADKKNLEFKKEELENILTQQIIISQLSNGISYGDTEYMDEYERIFILKKLIAMKKEEINARKEAMQKNQK